MSERSNGGIGCQAGGALHTACSQPGRTVGPQRSPGEAGECRPLSRQQDARVCSAEIMTSEGRGRLPVCPLLVVGAAVVGASYAGRLIARGRLTLDLGVGRSVRPLGPVTCKIAAPPELVFDVIAGPYLGRTPRALQQKLQVWERGTDMVLAAHFTPLGNGVATTLETVRFERPIRIDFRLVRGPVPHVAESFALKAVATGTELIWEGELGTDLWAVGRWWGDRVARLWESAVRSSFAQVTAEAERRAGASGAQPRRGGSST